MEFSSFSTGTERAVKTWQVSYDLHSTCRKIMKLGWRLPYFSNLQASIGAPEDGIMTAELLERLYIEQNRGTPSFTGGKGPEDSSTTNPEEVHNPFLFNGQDFGSNASEFCIAWFTNSYSRYFLS